MSGLADRIRGIVAPRTGGATSDQPPATSHQPPATSHRLDTLGGGFREGVYVIERQWDASARHGREVVGDAAVRLAASSSHAALFGDAAARPPFMFLDLETTGLSGGAGTYAFLVGCGAFNEDGGFATRQFLLARHADERAVLGAVARELESAGALVTYNGKSFDAPVLETRYLYHRLEWVGARVPHVDALHAARRFWGGDLNSPKGLPYGSSLAQAFRPADSGCTLQALEREVVGCRPRSGDVPGFEVPARYFQFVRTGDPRPLEQVLEHNRLDLLTLAVLAARLVHLAQAGPAGAQTAAEALALGRVYARAGLDDRAKPAFDRAIAMSRAPASAFDPVRVDALRLLALAWRRERRFDAAAACWQALIDTRGCPPSIRREAAEALAIHHEHRVRDLGVARTFALRSLEGESKPAWTRAVEYRLARLERKLANAQVSRSNAQEELFSCLER